MEDLRKAKHAALLDELRTHVADYLLATLQDPEAFNPDYMLSLSPDELRPQIVKRWRTSLEKTKTPHHPVFAPWHALASVDDKGFAEQAEVVVAKLNAGTGSGEGGGPSTPASAKPWRINPRNP